MPDRPLFRNRYRIEGRLGRGGFATVYLAHDTRMDRPVAIKVVDDDAQEANARTFREAQAAAKLNHPHIVTVHEVVREEGRTCIFTEYVEGQTLRRLFSRGSLNARQIVQAGVQLGRALEHAQRRGVIHRDIKPENIMVVDGEDVDVRVMDFGVAQLEDYSGVSREGDLVGTLAYMSPEQLRGEEVDHKADVYSLALSLYEGFTGSNPLKGRSPAELMKGPSRMVFTRLTRSRADLPPVLDEALRGGMEPNREERSDAATLRRLLEKALKEMPEEESRSRWPERMPSLADRVDPARLGYVGRRLVAGSAALATLGYVLPRAPFYPSSALFVLIAGVSFLALLSPALGGLAALALLAPPVFNFSLGWGIIYLVAAAIVYGILYRTGYEWAALLPGAAPPLAAWGLGLMFPPLAGSLLRWWGWLAGVAGALVLALAVGLEGWDPVPHTFSSGVGPVLLSGRHVASPGETAQVFGRFLDARPDLLLQMLLFGLFALPFRPLCRGAISRRLWVGTLYLGSLLTAFVLLPPVVVGVPVFAERLLWVFLPCVILVYLLAVLVPADTDDRTTGD